MSDIVRAHKHSSNHREELSASHVCGCFHCLKTFGFDRITEWIDWPQGTPAEQELELGTTAVCPYCGIDSVIGDRSGYPIAAEFLGQMQKLWFGASA